MSKVGQYKGLSEEDAAAELVRLGEDATADQVTGNLPEKTREEARAALISEWKLEVENSKDLWQSAAKVILDRILKNTPEVALHQLTVDRQKAGTLGVSIYYERAVNSLRTLADMREDDVNVIEVASLDGEHAANFSKPYICQHEDGRVVEFDSDDDACAYQREHRQKNGLDPETGEAVVRGKQPEAIEPKSGDWYTRLDASIVASAYEAAETFEETHETTNPTHVLFLNELHALTRTSEDASEIATWYSRLDQGRVDAAFQSALKHDRAAWGEAFHVHFLRDLHSLMQVPADPDGQNNDRAAWASTAINAFRQETRCDEEDAVADLLANLMHYCDRNGPSFETQLKHARQHYAAETYEPPARDSGPGLDI